MDIRNSNQNVFPRQPAGNQDHSVRRVNNQLNRAFGNDRNNNPQGTTRDNTNILSQLINLIKQLLSQLGKQETSPPPDEGARGVYGSPIGEITPPDEGARGVYGGAIGILPEEGGTSGVNSTQVNTVDSSTN